MSDGTLFGRAWRITVDTLQMTDVDVEFSVKRTLRPEPNTCDLKIYNLLPAHRRQIEQNPAVLKTKTVPVKIEAGYYADASRTSANLMQIYLGELRAGWTEKDGAEVVTELSSGDGEKAFCTARMNVSFGGATTNEVVMREILSQLGIGQGNIQKAISAMTASGQTMFSAKGVTLKGNAAIHMTDLCKSVGLEWSIQDGAAQFLALGQPLAGQVYKLNDGSGLIGSPSVDSKGVLTFQTLMAPGIVPGAVVQMDSVAVKGGYRITSCDYSGDTMGNDWFAKCQAEVY